MAGKNTSIGKCFFILIPLIFFGCGFFLDNTDYIVIDTGIELVPNSPAKILMKTKTGCSVSGFEIKSDFYKDIKDGEAIIASTVNDLRLIQERYFELPYLDTVTADFFESDYMVFILQWHYLSETLKNERIEEKNGYYFFYFEIEVSDWSDSCGGEIGLFILQLPKKPFI